MRQRSLSAGGHSLTLIAMETRDIGDRAWARSRPLLLFWALTMAAMACRFAEPDPPQPETGFLPLTALATRTPPAAPRRSCPVPDEAPSPPNLDEPSTAGRELETYLSQGGQVQDLSPAELQLEAWRPDVDGDGWVDAAVVLARGDPQSPEGRGALHVFRCQEDRFALIFSGIEQPPLGPPQLTHVADLSGDGKQELVVVRQACGAHTCTADLEVLVWSEGRLWDRFPDSLEDLPFPTIQVEGIEAKTGKIRIEAGGIGSVGAGPFRPLTKVWQWDPSTQVFHVTEEIEGDSYFRVHILHDADAFASEGNSAAAMQGYQRVINDDSLKEWVDPERERAVLGAFAGFRQMTLLSLAGDLDPARAVLDRMRQEHPQGSPGHPYLEMAEAYWLILEGTGDARQACLEAQAFASAHRASVLDPLYFGYSNPSYGPSDVCLPSDSG